MESLKRILFKKEISIEDLGYICQLLKTNMSLKECLLLIKNKRNEKIFNSVIAKLDEGYLIEEIIIDYLPSQIKQYMSSLLKTMSFEVALSLALEFYDKHKQESGTLIQSIAYPCILLFITITSLYLFDLYGMDLIFSLMKTFNTNLSFYDNLRIIFRIIINIFYYGVLIIICFLLYACSNKHITIFYMYMSKYFHNSLFNIYYSEEFVSLLSICINKGFKTKDTLMILKNMKSKPIVSFLAFHLDEALLEGESLNDAIKTQYYDSFLTRFIKIANYTNEMSLMLDNYTKFARDRIIKKLKRYSLTIQIATYSFIGVIIIFIYQILFMPMQALSGF